MNRIDNEIIKKWKHNIKYYDKFEMIKELGIKMGSVNKVNYALTNKGWAILEL